MKHLSIFQLFFIIFVAGQAAGNERFSNFSSAITVSDFERIGNNLYVASSGGLYIYDIAGKSGSLLQSNTNTPDPNTTAICSQGNNILWTGTAQGYLSRRTPPENTADITTYNSFFSSGWKILDLVIYGKYLLVASNKGVSIFNTENGYAEKNATKFGFLASLQVNALKIYNDTLYAGLNDGVAKFSIKDNPLNTVNFYNPGTWSIDTTTEKPVKSFLYSNGCRVSSGYADIFNGKIISGKDSILFLDTVQAARLPSSITALKVTAPNECWIGTSENYFYLWNGASLTQYKIPGLTMSSINRILVDNQSNVWFLPHHKGNESRWWVGIGSYIDETWKSYTSSTMNNTSFYMGDYFNNQGIVATPDNRIWFGTSGGKIKTFSSDKNIWKFYDFAYGDISTFSATNQLDTGTWGKCDAFTLDSSGYLWVSTYGNNTGALICYNYKFDPDNSQSTPNSRNYKRYFPSSDANYDVNFSCLHTDKSNRLFAGGEKGNIVVFRYNGNPLDENSLQILNTLKTDSVFDAVTIDDGKTYFATADGLRLYDPESNKFSIDDNFQYNAKSLAYENGDILWIGTADYGLVKYNVTSNAHSVYNTASGLISNFTRDIAIDRHKGFIWIATDAGISKFDLGYSISDELNGSAMEVFPNPYSVSKMKQLSVTIRNVPNDSKVAFYNSNGQLIAAPKLIRKGNGAYYSWKPGDTVVPGVYQLVVKSTKGSKSKLFMVSP